MSFSLETMLIFRVKMNPIYTQEADPKGQLLFFLGGVRRSSGG